MFFLETQTTPCGKPRFKQNSYCFVMLFQRSLWLLRDVQRFAGTLANSCLSKMGRRRRLDAFGESKHGVHTSILALISKSFVKNTTSVSFLGLPEAQLSASWFQFHNHVECSHFANTSWGMNLTRLWLRMDVSHFGWFGGRSVYHGLLFTSQRLPLIWGFHHWDFSSNEGWTLQKAASRLLYKDIIVNR